MAEFKNPNQGSGTDSRSFIVMLVVMVGVMVGLRMWTAKHGPVDPAPSTPALSQPAAPSSATAPTATAAPLSAAAQAAAVQAAAESTTVVENELYKITFSNRGGEVRSWILKRYKDNAGNPLDLVHGDAAATYGYPLSLYTYDASITRALAQGLYVASATGTLATPGTLTFKYAVGNLDVTKTFAFGSDYVIHADTVVLRDGAPIAAALSWPAGFGDMETAQAYASATVDLESNGSTDHIALKKVSGGATLTEPLDWAGLTDQYFGAIFLPDHSADATLVTLDNQLDVAHLNTSSTWRLHHGDYTGFVMDKKTGKTLVPMLGAALGSRSGHVQTRMFVGPKDWQVLNSIKAGSGESLASVVDFGFWGQVSKTLFLGLRWTHSLIAPSHPVANNYSWGWAIVLFTVFINLILLPLRIKGMSGMLKMQRIQPQVDAIKAKYKNPKATDPKMAEMNAEVMAYQKEQGVSMLSGCIPTLIQMPLLFAFFTMMTRVVELRQAHWFWLPDLSAADPYHILPIFMLVSSFLVQFYTPSPGVDPQQQKMMAFMMPAFSCVMTWKYASGLALYWNVGNLIMIVQQQIMNRTALGREMKALQLARAKKPLPGRPAAKTIQGKR